MQLARISTRRHSSRKAGSRVLPLDQFDKQGLANRLLRQHIHSTSVSTTFRDYLQTEKGVSRADALQGLHPLGVCRSFGEHGATRHLVKKESSGLGLPRWPRGGYGCPEAKPLRQHGNPFPSVAIRALVQRQKSRRSPLVKRYCGWLRNLLRTTLKPWEPVFVFGIYRGTSCLGFLGGAGFFPSTVVCFFLEKSHGSFDPGGASVWGLKLTASLRDWLVAKALGLERDV